MNSETSIQNSARFFVYSLIILIFVLCCSLEKGDIKMSDIRTLQHRGLLTLTSSQVVELVYHCNIKENSLGATQSMLQQCRLEITVMRPFITKQVRILS